MKTIRELIDYSAEKYAESTAVHYEFNGAMCEISFSRLKDHVYTIGYEFCKTGLEGSHIAIIGGLCYQWFVSFLSVICSGNVAVPIDKELSMQDIQALILKSDAEAVIIDGSSAEQLACLKENLPQLTIFTFQSLESCMVVKTTITVPAIPRSDQIAMIVFTSGTTGVNKGVMLTHRNLCENTLLSHKIVRDELFTGDKTIAILPPHHMFQITTGFLHQVYHGMSICFCKSLKYVNKSILYYKPELLVIVPMIAKSMYNKIWTEAEKNGRENALKSAILLSKLLRRFGIDLRRRLFRSIHDSFGGQLKLIICGGAFLEPELVSRFDDIGIFLRNGYGTTECSPVISCNTRAYMKLGSVGSIKDSEHCEVKIVDGEIWVKGSIVMKGYYKDENATSEAFDGDWYKTGDLGYVDKDGFLFITGRLKNLINLDDGNNISPEELEKLLEPIPLIKIGYVCARVVNKVQFVTACIFPDHDFAKANGITDIQTELERCIEKINMNLPRYKRIQNIEVFDNDFEKTALGKVKRHLYE